MFQLFGEQLSLPEAIGFASGVAGVWLTIRQNIWCFPVGIINVGIYSFIFFNSGLYSNAVLQLIYIAFLIYGWFHWESKVGADEFQVTSTSGNTWLILSIIGIIASALTGYLLKETTDSPLPYWDAATTSVSLIAQWMIARKKIENWLLWIAADIIYVGMCLYQSLYLHRPLYLTAILYFIYFLQAVKGYIEWKKTLANPASGVSR